MSRSIYLLAIAAVASGLLVSTIRSQPLYAGKDIRLTDGRHWKLLSRDSQVDDAWRVQVGRLLNYVPVVLTIDAEDLLAAERGDYPSEAGAPFGDQLLTLEDPT